MRKRFGISALVVLAIGASALTAQAQDKDKAVELTAGLLGFSTLTCSGCSTLTTVATGGAYVAAGFYLDPGLALEPSLAFSSISGGSSTITQTTLGLGLPIYFDKGWGRKGWFVAPDVSWKNLSCSGCSSSSQFGIGAAVGGKVSLNSDAALRLQAMYDYGFKSGNVLSTSTIGAAIGLSVFIK